MRESLRAEEWARVRHFCSQYTVAELEKKFPGKIGSELGRVAAMRTKGAIGLSPALVAEALKWCRKVSGPAGPAKSVMD